MMTDDISLRLSPSTLYLALNVAYKTISIDQALVLVEAKP